MYYYSHNNDRLLYIMAYRFIVFYVSMVLIAQYAKAAPAQYCVEETKDKKFDGGPIGPYKEETAKDARQCITSCVKDTRSGVRCKACVYFQSGGLCQKFTKSAKEVGLQLKPSSGVAYYEVLDVCPSTKAITSSSDDKRRDPAIEESGVASGSHAFAQKSMFENAAPPVVAKDPGIMETYQVRPVQTYGGGGSGCCNAQVTTCCVQVQVVAIPQPAPCCPAPQPQPCCPAPQPQPCCAAPQPQPCCPAPQPACCPAPNPEWGPWSAWSECKQVPCSPSGGGSTVQTRTRTCQGYGCIGEAQQQQPCGCLQGQWTEWGPPSTCSATCGGGTQTRTRTCTVPDTCQGPATDSQPCGQGSCANWGEWSGYEVCSSSCGQGTQSRRRSCVDYLGGPANGCSGNAVDTIPCPSLPPCCSNWTPWSSCATTCGTGYQTRTKTCDGGGAPQTEQQPCSNPQPCCSEWTQWSHCQAVCGQGYQTRTRTCGSGGGGYGMALGGPTIAGGGGSGGCCQQQQACSNGCSQNSFYGQQYYGKRRK